MWPTSLSMRLFWIILVALAPAVLVAVSNVFAVREERTTSLHKDASRIAELVSMEVDQTIVGAESVLRTAAAAPVTKMGLPGCTTLVTEVVASVDFLDAIIIMDTEGAIRCSSELASDTEELVSVSQAMQGLAAPGSRAGLAVRHPTNEHLLLPVVVPIDAMDDASSALAIGFLDLRWMQQRLERHSLEPGGSVTIADRDGTILARVPQPERFVGTEIPDNFMYLVTAAEPGSLEVVSQDGTQRILGYIPPSRSGSGLYVSAGRSTDEGYAVLRSIAGQSATITLLGTLIAAVVALYTARVFIARPVQTLIRTVTAWREGKTASRTGLDGRSGDIGVAGQSLDAFMDELLENRAARAKAEETRELLRDELEHREKNLLATVQAIARQTFHEKSNQGALQKFSKRLEAINTANRLLKQSEWQNSSLHTLIGNTVATFVGDDATRISASGPDISVNGNVSTALAMAIHELCTNAVKYGALSTDDGTVTIEWQIVEDGPDRVFKLVWTERGGPPVSAPQHRGFGSKVIRHALAAQTGGQVSIDYDPQGLTCTLVAPAATVVAFATEAA